ncbi:MAG: ATP synthase F1 subunit delta [Chitinophagaceae bacterium]|nr:ATP synthase F1 subunit delta [Chitinophagaceae bacterium]
MQNPRVAGRYAKSLVGLAQEQNQLEAVYADMKYLQDVCRQSKDFTNLLRSPVIRNEVKEKVLNEVVSKHVGTLSGAFIHLLVKKNRESNLPEIAAAVIDQYNEIKNIHRVKLTTATAASEEMKAAIVAKVKAVAGLPNVELETEVKESIIGGFQLEYKGNLIDASIARDLRDIQKQFQKNVYVRNIR